MTAQNYARALSRVLVHEGGYVNHPKDPGGATIEWQDANVYRRNHPLIEQLGAALSLSPTDIDAMWREAMAL